jgi:hypothetical protein
MHMTMVIYTRVCYIYNDTRFTVAENRKLIWIRNQWVMTYMLPFQDEKREHHADDTVTAVPLLLMPEIIICLI